jgi:hypothetical protein
MLVLRVVRCERHTSLTVNAGCWLALTMGIHATLMLAPECLPWRPKPGPATSRMLSRTVAAGPDLRRASNPFCAASGSGGSTRDTAQIWAIGLAVAAAQS